MIQLEGWKVWLQLSSLCKKTLGFGIFFVLLWYHAGHLQRIEIIRINPQDIGI